MRDGCRVSWGGFSDGSQGGGTLERSVASLQSDAFRFKLARFVRLGCAMSGHTLQGKWPFRRRTRGGMKASQGGA